MHFYQSEVAEVQQTLDTSLVEGLSSAEASLRLAKYGPNQIHSQSEKSFISLFIEQLKNPIVLILLGTTAIAIFAGKGFEAFLIGGIVVFMAVVGAGLEKRAGKAVQKLQGLTQLQAHVIRDGKQMQIAVSEIVIGDVLSLQEGDRVPADARLTSVNELQIDESILTGESIPVSKTTETITAEATIADQTNMVFSGTFVVQGNARAVVIATGNETEIGQIAKKLGEEEEKQTPLQKELEKLGKVLLVLTLAICGVVVVLSLTRGETFIDALIQSLSLAIAFIPEGLTAVMTVVLAVAVKEMVEKKVIIKRLLAAEGLGSVSIVATDKTGTITAGNMHLNKLWVYSREFESSDFKITNDHEKKLIDVIRYCNNGKGPTESALVKFLIEHRIEFELENRVEEHRFSSALKRMSVVKNVAGKLRAYSKGAPDILLELCTEYVDHKTGNLTAMSDEIRAEIVTAAESYAKNGYRVLCLAEKELADTVDTANRELVEKDMVFLGLICLIDPLRPEVPETVAKFIQAGIRPVLITGDHPAIATTIALQAGIISTSEAMVITGKELDDYFNEGENTALRNRIKDCRIFARVVPEHKDKLVELFQSNGYKVAMAGDGINDVLAISKSDIGIAVANATDVAKEAADIVLNGFYDAIINAVELGRLVMLRSRLYLHYLLSGNFCQVGVFVLALVFNTKFPLTPTMLLIINLITDAAPAMAMAFEKSGENLLKQSPRSSKEGFLNGRIYLSIGLQGILASAYLFIVFILFLPQGLLFAQTAAFTAYIWQKLLRAFTARSFKKSIFQMGIFSNKFITASVLFGFIIWAIIVYLVPDMFKMQPIPLTDLAVIIATSLIMPVAEEVLKFLTRKS